MYSSETVRPAALDRAPPRRCVRRLLLAAALGFLCVPASSYAHHGRDFLLLQTADLPHGGQIYFVSRQDYVSEEEDEVEWEPTFLVGILDRLTFEAHGHVAREGDEPFTVESISPALHLRLSRHDAPWKIGVFAEYEISQVDDHDDRAEGRLSAVRNFAKGRFAANLVAEEEQADDASVEWGYVLGFRRAATGVLDWGLELEGSFEDGRGQELLLGLYHETSHRFTFNVGVGTGLGDNETDLSVRTALIWRAH